ncbi:carbohydrate ABC transporter permease [Paenibacillus sp. LHD-117]|uniref:carbohydrate ABC transporter permease n=1 Tax=Paenibacillus sp. LHD-117 TaxID=3071412 RepID=UPI0027DFA6E7|nr:carbohydrate ABC transporter permease [Paenibacillus sp. LHD-117]MDQ6421466.1 carbohydrate ABC transporter permease [Paenibacillus sp. LHD-117]
MRSYIKLTREDRIVNAIVTIIGVLAFLATFYPLYYLLIYSLNDPVDAAGGQLYWFPRQFTFDNYAVIFRDEQLLNSFLLTVARTAIGTVTGVLFTAIGAYALSKPRLVFRKTYSMIGLVTMYVSGGLIPTYLLLQKLHLLNSFWVYIVPSLFNIFNALLFMAFFRQLPEELEESAKVDGGGDFYIFARIILPLSKPVLATVALFVAVNHWNDWFSSAYFVSNQQLWTLPTIIVRMLSDTAIVENMQSLPPNMRTDPLSTLMAIKYATLIVTVLPITLVYPFIQKYFVQGMMVGAIKA